MSDETKQATLDVNAIRERNAARTPGRWCWGPSNSFRRLSSSQTGKDGDVAYGCVHPHDGHPDIAISEPDMAFIEHATEDIPALLKGFHALTKLAEQFEVNGEGLDVSTRNAWRRAAEMLRATLGVGGRSER